MKMVLLGDLPLEVQAFLDRRRELGQDRFDEVWEGEYHVVLAPHPWHAYLDGALVQLLAPYARAAGLVGTTTFNLGDPDDFRVPDQGYHRSLPSEVWVPTAAIVVEVLSPHDETYAKFGFYARHQVDEICTADPRDRVVRWFRRMGARYEETGRSDVLGLTVADLISQIDWPG